MLMILFGVGLVYRSKTSLGIGVAKDGFLSKYGPKIHPIDISNPQPWSGGEYFVILIQSFWPRQNHLIILFMELT